MSATKQPRWKCIGNLGDASPLDFGGAFVSIDETGVYDPEMEILESPGSDEAEKRGDGWTVYRVTLEPCTFRDGILSDNSFHPDYPAWFAEDLPKVADCSGIPEEDLREALCSPEPMKRAGAYLALAEYFGKENFDAYPLHFSRRSDLRWKRYRAILDGSGFFREVSR